MIATSNVTVQYLVEYTLFFFKLLFLFNPFISPMSETLVSSILDKMQSIQGDILQIFHINLKLKKQIF